MIAIKIAHMHSSMFLGTNLEKRIDATKKQGLKLWHDPVRDLLFIQLNGRTGVCNTWELLEPYDVKDYDVAPVGTYVEDAPPTKHHTQGIPEQIAAMAQLENPTTKPTAKRGRPPQVQTPLDHVHAGPGAGKTRD